MAAQGTGKGGSKAVEMSVDQQGGTPQKRRAPENEGGNLSLDVIREAIRGELQGALQEVRQDIKGFAGRIDNVESQVTRQMQQTINMLDEITSKYTQHGEILQQLQEANSEVKIRLEKLERSGGGSSEQAERILKSVNAPIALQPLFVPGVRRGYAILPIDERLGESFESRRQRVQEVITKVCSATAGKMPGTEDVGPGWVDIATVTRVLHLDRAEVEKDKNPGEKDSAQDTAADERDARTPLGDTNPTGDTSTDKTDYDLRGKDSGNAPTKEELPDWSDPAGDVAPVTPPSSPYEATGAGEAAPVTPSLLKDDETVDVGLKQLWPTQAAWLWPTQAAWNVVFQCCDDEVPARRVGSAATGGAPDTAPAEDDGRPRAFQPGEDHVLAYLPDADDLEVLVEEEPLPTTNGTAAQAGEQRAAEIRRRRAEEQRRQGR
eukprot:s907_g18.t3